MNATKYFELMTIYDMGDEYIKEMVISDISLKFRTLQDFEKCQSFLNQYYSELYYFCDITFLEINFTKYIERDLLNDLEYSPLIDFEYRINGLNVMDTFDYVLL